MSNTIDFKILELLASKICHDLISPIGAVNNGLEILEEIGEDGADEVTDLIAFSAQQASAKLQAYRMAYGAGGADANIKPEDVYNAIESIVSKESKFTQTWDPHGDLGPDERPNAFCKILISTLLLAMKCLPKGGELSVLPDAGKTVVKASGEDAGIRESIEEASSLQIPLEQVEPKHVHAYICGLLAQNYGYTLELRQTDPETVTITFSTTG